MEPWIDGLWEALESVLSSTSSGDSTIAANVDPEPSSQLHVHVHVHDLHSSMSTSPSRTIGEKLVVDDNLETVKTAAVNSSDGGVGVVGTEDKIDATCVQDAQSEISVIQTQPNGSILVQRTSTVIGELATSFADQVQLSQSSTEHRSMSTGHSNSSTTLSASSSLNGGETKIAQSSGVDVDIHVAAISETEIEGMESVKEDASARDEFKTPSVELSSVPLVLPSVQPPFIEVMLKTVSVYTYMYMYIAYQS